MHDDESEEAAAVEALSWVDTYRQAMSELQDTLKSGWMNIASARYSTGASRVGQLQYDQDMQALSTVEVSGSATQPDFMLRSRPAVPRLSTGAGEVEDGSLVDPLHWFGGMPPRSLRLAQTDFKTALELVMQAATAATRVPIKCRSTAVSDGPR